MIVEFVGMSGSGKSTLIRRVERLLRDANVEVNFHCAGGAERTGDGRQPTRERRRELLLGISDAPSLAVVLAAHRRGSKRFRSVVHYIQSVAYTNRLSHGPEIHLLDEGPLKRLPKGYGWRSWEYRIMRRAIPPADLIVHVVCDTDVRIDRLRRLRGKGGGFTDQQLREQEAGTLARLRAVLAAQSAPVLEVDPNVSEDAPARVVEWIGSTAYR